MICLASIISLQRQEAKILTIDYFKDFALQINHLFRTSLIFKSINLSGTGLTKIR